MGLRLLANNLKDADHSTFDLFGSSARPDDLLRDGSEPCLLNDDLSSSIQNCQFLYQEGAGREANISR